MTSFISRARASESALAPATDGHVGKLPSAVDARADSDSRDSFFLATDPGPAEQTPSKPRVAGSIPAGRAERLSRQPATAQKYSPSVLSKMARRLCIRCGAPASTKAHCRPCADAQRDASLARIKAIQNAYFAGKCCEFCGSTNDLEADHIVPASKDPRIRCRGHRAPERNMWTLSDVDRIAELAKCRPLCRPCHRERHRVMMRVHGTENSYRKHGCRCEACVAWRESHPARKSPATKPKRVIRFPHGPHACRSCGVVGHNTRTCPLPTRSPNVPLPAREPNVPLPTPRPTTPGRS
jgi:hypothetical protein